MSHAPPFSLLVRNTSRVLTLQSSPGRGQAERGLGAIEQGVIGLSDGKIAFLGAADRIPPGAVTSQTEVLDAGGGFVGPGFVDPHTHVVFAGDRHEEFELRNQGASYLDIAQAGGGIASTVKATRAASAEQLAEAALPRLRRLLEHGVTTAEVKSGYGLTLKDELKMLEVIRMTSQRQPIELHATLLCAHAVPAEYRERRQEYVRLCVEEVLPAAVKQGIARFCDVFADEGAFTLEEARQILKAAKSQGLLPRLHADQLSQFGSASLAAELGCTSADHLEHVSDSGIRALADNGVVAVLMPTTTLFLRQAEYAPGRRLWDAGCLVALATNVNPGSAMSENHALTLGLACLRNALTADQAYWAATRGGALALKLPRHGELVQGGIADLVVFSCASHRHLPYHLGVNHVRHVIKAGQVVLSRQEAPPCVG